MLTFNFYTFLTNEISERETKSAFLFRSNHLHQAQTCQGMCYPVLQKMIRTINLLGKDKDSSFLWMSFTSLQHHSICIYFSFLVCFSNQRLSMNFSFVLRASKKLACNLLYYCYYIFFVLIFAFMLEKFTSNIWHFILL